jgi:DNA-binding CsgD family transcriptional regulator
VAIAVDDVQWLDPPSAFVLGFALRRMRDEPIAFLFALRAGEADVLDLDRALPEERIHRLVVGPLSLGALQRLLKDRLDLVLSRPRLRRVHELSGGNPFFALELGRAFKRGAVRLEPGESLPSRLAALVDDRLEALPADTRAALLVASALSRPTIELVGRAGIGEPGEQLAPALEANVIEFDHDRIRFSHPLLASGVYGAASLSERRALHRRLADAVSDPEERVRHLALAAEGPHPDVASALEEAAGRAHSRGALASAAELSLQARQLTPLDHADERHRRAIQAVAYAFESGDSGRARALLEEALTSAPAGPPRALALYWLGCLEEYEGDRRAAVELYREALAVAGDDLAMCSMLEDGIAVALFLMREDLPAAAAHARAAVDFADRIGDVSAKMMALGNQGLIDTVLGHAEGKATLERGVEVERTLEAGGGIGGVRLVAAPSVLFASALTWTDEFERARTIFTSARDHAYDRAEESSLPWILLYLGLIEFVAGRWDAAEQYARDGIDIAGQTNQEPQRLSALAVHSLVGACRGDVEEARADVDTVLSLADAYGAMLARIIGSTAVGLLELSLDRPEEAHQVLGPLGDRLESGGVREPGSVPFVPDDIEALIRLDRLAEAEALLERLERRARRLDRASALAAAARCRGLLAATRGDLDGALTSLERAMSEHERVPMPFERARTLLALGATRRRAKRRRAARESLDESLAIFEELGARLWSEKAREELARIGGRPKATGDLTPTERRVAALVAEGRSNKEVAAALFVTVKTVESNLSRVYAKLGIRSRAELAHRLTAETRGNEASKP